MTNHMERTQQAPGAEAWVRMKGEDRVSVERAEEENSLGL